MEDEDFPIIRVEQQKVLTMFKIAFRTQLTKQAMLQQNAHVEAQYNHMVERSVFKLKSYVLQDPEQYAKVVFRFEEYPRYETWREHLVDSLPKGSIRRRVLGRFFGFADTEVLGKRINHEVIAERRLLFPDASIPEWYPPELGQAGWIYGVKHNIDDIYGEDYR